MRTFVHHFIWLLLLAVAFEQATCKVYVRRRFDPEEQAQARFTAGFINKFSTTTTTTTTTTAPVTTTVSTPATTSTPITTSTVPAPTAASPTATATARDTLPTSSDLDSGFFNDDDGFGKANDLSGDFSEEPEDSVSSADYESDAPANYVRMQKHRPAPAAAEQEAEEESDDNSERMHNSDDAEDDDEEDAASADDDEEGQENAVGRAARAQPSEWNRRQMNRRMTNRQIQRLENEYKRRIKTLRERQKAVLRRNALRNRRTAAVRRRRLQNRQREIEKRTRLQRQRRRRRLQNQRRRRQQKQKARRRQIQNQNRLNRFRRGGGNRRIVRVVL